MNRSKYNSGFSLLQTIISIGILTFLFLVGFRLIRNQVQVSQSSSGHFEVIYLFDEIRSFLSDPKNCTISLRGKNAGFEEIDFFKTAVSPGEKKYQVFGLNRQTYGPDKIKILSMTLEPGEKEYNLENNQTLLHIDFELINEFMIPEVISKKTNIHIDTDEIGLIQNCRTLGGFTWNPGARKKQYEWVDQKVNNSIHFPGHRIFVGKADIMSTGNFIVQGGLLVKSPKINFNCNNDRLGVIRYNSVNTEIEGCNGEKWDVLSRNQNYNFSRDEIDLTVKNKELKNLETAKSYYYCEVDKFVGHDGSCRVTPTLRGKKSPWTLRAQHLSGQTLRCKLKCYY